MLCSVYKGWWHFIPYVFFNTTGTRDVSVRYGIEGNDTKDDDQVQNTNADVYYSTETEYSLSKQNSLTYNYSFDWEKNPQSIFTLSSSVFLSVIILVRLFVLFELFLVLFISTGLISTKLGKCKHHHYWKGYDLNKIISE